tara:strand:+ start:660 stop:911 length:252 start_codon:yes stop_codon:yes gene_type:complete
MNFTKHISFSNLPNSEDLKVYAFIEGSDKVYTTSIKVSDWPHWAEYLPEPGAKKQQNLEYMRSHPEWTWVESDYQYPRATVDE